MQGRSAARKGGVVASFAFVVNKFRNVRTGGVHEVIRFKLRVVLLWFVILARHSVGVIKISLEASFLLLFQSIDVEHRCRAGFGTSAR